MGLRTRKRLFLIREFGGKSEAKGHKSKSTCMKIQECEISSLFAGMYVYFHNTSQQVVSQLWWTMPLNSMFMCNYYWMVVNKFCEVCACFLWFWWFYIKFCTACNWNLQSMNRNLIFLKPCSFLYIKMNEIWEDLGTVNSTENGFTSDVGSSETTLFLFTSQNALNQPLLFCLH